MDALRAAVTAFRERLYRLTAGLSRLCEFLLMRWPLYLLLCLVFAGAAFLPALLPMIGLSFAGGWWCTLLAALSGLPVLLGLVYMLHPLPPSPGWQFSHQPLSSLGEAKVVLADTSLLTDGRRETLIALPLEPTDDLRKRPEVATLAIAIAYTARLQNEETEAVLLETAAALGVKTDNLTRLRPVIGKTRLGAIPGVIVEDGKGQTSYFVGDPLTLSAMCAGMDGLRPHSMTAEDRERIRSVTLSLRRQGNLTLGFAALGTSLGMEEPIYLGLLSLRDVVSEDAVAAVDAMLQAGYSLQTQPIDEACQPPMRLAALRQRLGLTDALYEPQVILSTAMLDTRALCIAAVDHRHRRFDAPLLLAREWFGKVAAWLRIAVGTALPLLLGCVIGPSNALCGLPMLGLLALSLTAAASDDRRWDLASGTLLAVTLLTRLFLLLVPAIPAGAAMGLFAVAAAWVLSLHLSRRWQTTLLCAGVGLLMTAMAWLLPGLPLLGGLLAMFAGALAGLGAGQLLRMP